MSAPSDVELQELAAQAGIAPRWTDFRGQPHEVAPPTLRRLLAALDLPCDSAAQSADSRAWLAAAAQPLQLPPLVTAVVGGAIDLPRTALPDQASAGPGAAYVVLLEDGRRIDGRLRDSDGRLRLSPVDLAGYHELRIGNAQTTLAVAPRGCRSAHELCRDRAGRPWGLAAQLYGLCAPGDGGIGTYGALGQLAARLASRGAAALAVSPVHAMFSAEPAHRSPYSPSSRLLFNALHVDPREAFGERASQAQAGLGLDAAAQQLESQALIDWPVAGAARLAVLHCLYDRFLAADPTLVADFEDYRQRAGAMVEDHARFEALHAHFLARGDSPGVWSWRQWPAEFRDPQGPAVERFAHQHVDEVRFHVFLQWLAARGLAGAQSQAREAGMPIGLVADLAIGSHPDGSHVWSRQRETLTSVSIGAPPDELAMQGQVWGLATLSPTAMRDTGFSAFIELLRASMAHAGGIRIDHVMGLMRLWLVPEGASPLEGAYLAYPWRDLLRLVALESRRHDCLVVGEDLGTVPAGFGDTLAAHGVPGMDVLWFRRDGGGGFAAAADWRPQAVAMTTTHDLPTAAGWWLGRDIDVRRELGLVESEAELAGQRAQRERDRENLWSTIRRDGAGDSHHDDADQPAPSDPDTFVDAAIAHVGRTPSALALVPVEDVLGLTDAPNVPGTRDEHPNWRRRLPGDIDTLLESQSAQRRLSALDRTRK